MKPRRLDEFDRTPGWKACCDRVTHVYGLIDPRDGTVRYVGVSVSPKSRLRHHIDHPTNWRMEAWLKELAPLKPEVKSLAVVCICNWDRAEASWIAFFRSAGELYNIHDGGAYGKARGVPKFQGSRKAQQRRGVSKKKRRHRKRRKPRWMQEPETQLAEWQEAMARD